jgi:GntR family transcriptional regulator
MKLELNDISNIPLQQQIYSKIKAKILSGELISDFQLPSIRTFAIDNRISVITVQKAYEILEIDGLIYSKRSKGFFVKSLDESVRNTIASENLIREVNPILKKAIAEGLTSSEISKIINEIIKDFGEDL